MIKFWNRRRQSINKIRLEGEYYQFKYFTASLLQTIENVLIWLAWNQNQTYTESCVNVDEHVSNEVNSLIKDYQYVDWSLGDLLLHQVVEQKQLHQNSPNPANYVQCCENYSLWH